MGQSLGTSQKGSVNVELNIVPFIDLMSCLTAFLLVTAVWVNTAGLENQAAGKGKDGIGEKDPPKVAVLLEYDRILVQSYPSGEARQMAAYDWPRLEDALREFKTPDDAPPQVEVAASSSDAHPVEYKQVIAAMDTALRAGYPRVGVTDPSSLTR